MRKSDFNKIQGSLESGIKYFGGSGSRSVLIYYINSYWPLFVYSIVNEWDDIKLVFAKLNLEMILSIKINKNTKIDKFWYDRKWIIKEIRSIKI